MEKYGLMTDNEMESISEFSVTEDVSVDAMAIDWPTVGKIVLGVAGAFL